MSAESNTQQVQAYFLIDRSVKEMESRVQMFQKELARLKERLEGNVKTQSRVWSKVIGMGSARYQVIESYPEYFGPLGCDLEGALQLLESLRAGKGNQDKVEVFVLLYSKPGGDWRTKIESLKVQQDVRITVFAFAEKEKIGPSVLREIRTWDQGALRLKRFDRDNTKQVFERIFDILVDAVRVKRNTFQKLPPKAASVQPMPLQQVPFLSSDQAKLKNGVVPPDMTGSMETPREGNVVGEFIAEERIATSQRAARFDPWAEMNKQDAVPPPPVDEGGKATNWQELDPPKDDPDWVDHVDKKVLHAPNNWQLIGASRRGKMHAHQARFREDAFALGEAAGWHLMVVADGGGSCSLSRVGSQLAADTAVKEMVRIVEAMRTAEFSAKEVCEIGLEKSLEKAWKALQAEADEREGIFLGDLGTTFLALMHRPDEKGHVVGVAQVGDGLVAAKLADGKPLVLAEPDVGETASVTFFLTSKPWKEWVDRVKVDVLDTSPQLLVAMCDGVADDLIPFKKRLPILFKELEQRIQKEEPEEALLDFLEYEQRGSFDDRTLTLICPVKVGPDQPVAKEMPSTIETQLEDVQPPASSPIGEDVQKTTSSDQKGDDQGEQVETATPSKDSPAAKIDDSEIDGTNERQKDEKKQTQKRFADFSPGGVELQQTALARKDKDRQEYLEISKSSLKSSEETETSETSTSSDETIEDSLEQARTSEPPLSPPLTEMNDDSSGMAAEDRKEQKKDHATPRDLESEL